MNQVAEDILQHYGIKRRSGRYPWGSGEDPYQRTGDFLSRVEELRKQDFKYTDEKGKTWTGDTAIAKHMGLTTSQFRTEIGLVQAERRMIEVARAKSLKADGLGYSEIGRKMGLNESTVRSLLDSKSEERMNRAKETADFLRARSEAFKAEDGLGMIDVGKGAELEFRISREKLNQALYLLQREGYGVYNNRIEQMTNPGNFTTQMVLCPPHIKPKEGAKAPSEIYQLDKIHTVKDYISRDGGESFEKKFSYPESMDSKRLKVRYAEEGGELKDGIVELRRGVEDLSLGESRYSQVRILVDGTHYIKGMAVYSDNMPDGVDVIFNTNKKQGTPMTSVLKPIKADPDNPFGSAIKDADQGGQYWYTDKNGNRKLGLINKRADEGDWDDWKDALPSQFLGKQSQHMAKKQLDLAKADKQAEFDDICALTNPTIKKHLLQKFSDECDAAAVNLQAAALPGQKYHVIIPINSLKDTEVYAPNYENGTKLALIRYPHGGTFEIPILTVNNKHAEAKKLLGTDVIDAVGITKKVADQLSGADFDGDTVMCIPTHDPGGKVKIANRNELPGLKGFDPKDKYKWDDVTTDADGTKHYYQNGQEFRAMKKSNVQNQMGTISNLITDMTLAGAPDDELAAAVRHSMVVIDAEKHKLNYRQSEIDNNIPALHMKYQGRAQGGAATILSKSKGQASVDRRQGSPIIDPETGKVSYKKSDDLYYPDRGYNKEKRQYWVRTADGKKIAYSVDDKDAVERYSPVKRKNPVTGEVEFTDSTGDIVYKRRTRTQKTTKMAKTDDAYTLVSEARHPMELIYADYANSMKALANQARKEMVSTGKIAYSSSAKVTYLDEVNSLNEKLRIAELNRTRERAAQRMSNWEVKSKLDAGQLDKSDVKKASQRAVSKYRDEYGSIKRRDRNIDITDREWSAIQAGAISESTLKRILNNTDVSKLRERATPRTSRTLSASKINTIKAMRASNYTLAQIAAKLGVSTSTVASYM